MTDPCSAHIFPHATSRTRDFHNINSLLLHLWGEEQSTIWAQQYQRFTETEATQNGISMNHQIHYWFDNAKFALKPLKPLGQDNNSIVVQWHWLKPTMFKPKDRTCRYDSTATILEKAGLMDKNWGTRLAHRESGVPIRTGQIFTIRADNPEDLPSWDLLELSWNLLRVAAICGAADVPDEYWDESDDDDEEWPQHAIDAAIVARAAAIIATEAATDAQAVTAVGQGSVLTKEETKERIAAKGAGKEEEEGAGKKEEGAADDASRGGDESGSKASHG